jgi:hypothetical protein
MHLELTDEQTEALIRELSQLDGITSRRARDGMHGDEVRW